MKIEFDLTQDQIDTLKTIISNKYNKLNIDRDSYKNILEDIDKHLNTLEIFLKQLES